MDSFRCAPLVLAILCSLGCSKKTDAPTSDPATTATSSSGLSVPAADAPPPTYSSVPDHYTGPHKTKITKMIETGTKSKVACRPRP
jgi:hypothetical protein